MLWLFGGTRGSSYASLDVSGATITYRHPFARRHNADPSTEGLADQQRERKIREEDWRREAQERARDHGLWASKARYLSAWAQRR